eukprot:gnl/Dysnectes_brevis/998_a1113_1272.p1 GENE.gnl/Dysnectes_brevis/998_a1113_1272~~gnl/Dysnectes_brevis/998_a1113_1272.p1  ORF type:complete len:1062 (-),score=274.97 gnl/Dysnectes_brevis/998_a1113_1272:1656-4841(-)
MIILCISLLLVSTLVTCGNDHTYALSSQSILNQGVSLKYASSWTTVYIHYSIDGGEWNDIPGDKMDLDLESTMFIIFLNDVYASLEFVLTNGNGDWDNNHGNNYLISNPGTFMLKGDSLTQLTTECPDCSDHGQCLADSSCICESGYDFCGEDSGCVELDTDQNCGACGVFCSKGDHDASAHCVDGLCARTCIDGYQLCSDNTCQTDCGIQPGSGIECIWYDADGGPIPPNPSQLYLHYREFDGDWTIPPGLPMTSSSVDPWGMAASSGDWWTLCVDGNSIEYDLSDGTSWDNNGGGNYKQDLPGVYATDGAQGTTTVIAQYPKGCPGTPPCSGQGTCADGTCECTSPFWGSSCQNQCPEDEGDVCGAHGQCSSDVGCECVAGYGACDGGSCSFDLSSDINNCGACGNACQSQSAAEVLLSECDAGTCVVQCTPGYQQCPDATCALECPPPVLPGCDVYHVNQCSGDTIVTSDEYTPNQWQTPLPGSSRWEPGFGGYGMYNGHVRHQYTDPSRTENRLEVIVTAVNDQVKDLIRVSFDGGAPSSQLTRTFNTDTHPVGADPVTVTLSLEGYDDRYNIVLDAVSFYWQTHAQNMPTDGTKGAIVEMFGWSHADVARECEVIGKAGYLGVKLFPANDHLISYQPMESMMNPWYLYYQPVGFDLNGRHGDRAELLAAIQTCRDHGVRVYQDSVLNHMTGNGNDKAYHRDPDNGCTYWLPKNSTRGLHEGIYDPPFYTQGWNFQAAANTYLAPLQEFPASHYGVLDFHCERSLNSWTDPLDLNAGWLTGLCDANTEREWVQDRIADYLADLLSAGFSGTRIDAAKHIHPYDLAAIFGKFKERMGGYLPTSFVSWLEVLTGGESSLLLGDPSSDYSFSVMLEQALESNGLSSQEIEGIKIWMSGYPVEPHNDSGNLSPKRKAIQNDDHDQSYGSGSTSRDMHDRGDILTKTLDTNDHRSFEVKLFDSPYEINDNANDWPLRLVLSGYYWQNGISSVPDGLSDCKLKNTDDACVTVPYTPAYQSGKCSYEGPVYTRVHRDVDIINAMRRWMGWGELSAGDLGLPSRC